MDNASIKSEFSVIGKDELSRLLDEMIQRAQQDAEFAAKVYDISFKSDRSSMSESLIKIDLSNQPFNCYYTELYGRPASSSIKAIFEEKKLPFFDLHKVNLLKKITASITGEIDSHPNTVAHMHHALASAIKQQAWDKLLTNVKPAEHQPGLVESLKKLGIFKEKEEIKAADQPQIKAVPPRTKL